MSEFQNSNITDITQYLMNIQANSKLFGLARFRNYLFETEECKLWREIAHGTNLCQNVLSQMFDVIDKHNTNKKISTRIYKSFKEKDARRSVLVLIIGNSWIDNVFMIEILFKNDINIIGIGCLIKEFGAHMVTADHNYLRSGLPPFRYTKSFVVYNLGIVLLG
ncbi:hypothetical protein RCL_jg8268.t1 [Rhizophagus clarus]|uniref:Uncharacterized protein n=1 Tax=Rhizophagus clarus TaxID=94130 RepID=A0A8H3MFP0_9GLOM|nr:hypothetical protein RCL_jg8268.t1 [Rhizophagus clarus]